MIDIIKSLITILLFTLSMGLIGIVISNILAFDKVPAYRKILLGFIVFIVVYSVFQTSGKTIFTLSFSLVAFYIFNRKEPKFKINNPFKWSLNSIFTKNLFSEIGIFILVVFLFSLSQMYHHHYFNPEIETFGSKDKSCYVIWSSTIENTGVENWYSYLINFGSNFKERIGFSPYHYYDLWGFNVCSLFTFLSPSKTYLLVFHPLLSSFALLSFFELFFILYKGQSKLLYLLLSLVFFTKSNFINGLTLNYTDGWDVTHTLKGLALFPFIMIFLMLMNKKDKVNAYIVILFTSFVNILSFPAAFGLVFILGSFDLVCRKKTEAKRILQFILIFTGLIALHYYVFKSENMIFNAGSVHYLNVFEFTKSILGLNIMRLILNLFFYVVPLILLIVIIDKQFFKMVSELKLFELITMGFIYLTVSVLAYSFVSQMKVSMQIMRLAYSVITPLFNGLIVLISFHSLVNMKLSLQKKIVLSAILVLVIFNGLGCINRSISPLIKPYLTVSSEFMNEIRDSYVPKSKIGLVYPNQISSDLRAFPIQTESQFVTGIAEGCFSIRIGKLKMRHSEENMRKASQMWPIYDYIINTSDFDTSMFINYQLNFIKDNNVDFMVSRGINDSNDVFVNLFEKRIVDKKSGLVFHYN